MNINIRLTSDNAYMYIGRQIIYKTRGLYKINTILEVYEKSIKVENEDLGNFLQLGRKIFVLPDN